MQKADKSKQLWRNLIIPITLLIIVVGDILTKNWIRSFPPDGQTIYKLGFMRIIHITNTGSAFGAFQGYALALAIVGILGVRECFLAKMYKNGRIRIPNLTMALLKRDKPSLEGYAMEVTLGPT